MDELGALLGFYSLDGLVWVWFRVGFPVFALIDALWFADVHVFFFPLLIWCSCSLMFTLFDSGFDVIVGFISWFKNIEEQVLMFLNL